MIPKKKSTIYFQHYLHTIFQVMIWLVAASFTFYGLKNVIRQYYWTISKRNTIFWMHKVGFTKELYDNEWTSGIIKCFPHYQATKLTLLLFSQLHLPVYNDRCVSFRRWRQLCRSSGSIWELMLYIPI